MKPKFYNYYYIKVASEKSSRFVLFVLMLSNCTKAYNLYNINKLNIYNKLIFGVGALPDRMLVVRIIENNKIDAYFRSC